MTDDEKLMQQALEALELAYAGIDAITVHGKAITALRERLAQPDWVGLTDEEVKALPQWFPSHETAAVLPLIRAIEAKLKEKNT